MSFIKQLIKQIFQYEARLILRRYKPKIIAITGSVGKTTTRDALYAILAKKFFVRKSEKSFTTELGIPLTIIGCPYGTGSVKQWFKNILIGLEFLISKKKYPEWLILEIDGDTPGDFHNLAGWLQPHILVVTAIGDTPAHVEPFGSIEELLAEKKRLLDSVVKNGLVVFNGDDLNTSQLVSTTSLKTISCGIHQQCEVCGTQFNILYGTAYGHTVPTGMTYEISESGQQHTLTMFNSIGIHLEYASLISYAVGRELGTAGTTIIDTLNQYSPLPGRMSIISGMNDTTIIDDSYNSSPIALQESLHTFQTLSGTGRKIVVIGDMLELGKYSVPEHKKIANLVKDFSYVLTVGIRSRGIAEELVSLGFKRDHIFSFDTAEQAGKELRNILESGDVVFVKGSQAMRMERVVKEVLRHPEDAFKLLVRQEPEWQVRD